MAVVGGENGCHWGHEDEEGGSGGNWAVNKFGGTSVASAAAMTRVRDIILCEMTRVGSPPRMAVVVSAMGGKPKVTDLLLSTVAKAAAGDRDGAAAVLREIREKHTTCIAQLPDISSAERERLVAVIERDMKDLDDLLRAVSLMRHQNERMLELISGYGETWSSQVLCALLNASEGSAGAANVNGDSGGGNSGKGGRTFHYLDARRVLVVEESPETGPELCWPRSEANTAKILSEVAETDENHNGHLVAESDQNNHLVITGFVASAADGAATTLKRDGSDYSATIFGRLLRAALVNIWTDVDGVLSADPRRVPEAAVLQDISFSEAMELAYFGAKVLHPKTMLPAAVAGIPVHIRNTFNPLHPGTRIFKSSTATQDRRRCVCGFSTVDGIALLNIEGSGMIGVPGVAKRLFGALQEMGVSVVLISQASSEHSISVAVKADQAEAAARGVREAFSSELRRGLVSSVDVLSPCCIVAAVGDGMSRTTGVAGSFFSALGAARINVLAIAQGCSERNISCVVSEADSARALRSVHAAFQLSPNTVSVGVVGVGMPGNAQIGAQGGSSGAAAAIETGGAAFLDLLAAQRELFQLRYNCDLRVRAIAVADKNNLAGEKGEEKRMLLCEDSVDLPNWRQQLQELGESLDLQKLEEHVTPAHLPHAVMIDFDIGEIEHDNSQSSHEHSDAAARRHCGWLSRGMHVVSSNASANGGGLAAYHKLLVARGQAPGSYHCGATVGAAGLPLLATLQSLQSTGDDVRRVDAVVSAGLSYVFSRISPAPANAAGAAAAGEQAAATGAGAAPVPFSVALGAALAAGLFELADLQMQLSGEDERRRCLILGRELGLELSAADVAVSPVLLPEELASIEALLSKNLTRSEEMSPAAWEAAVASAGLAAADARLARAAAAAAARGSVLRHACSVDAGGETAAAATATAGVCELPAGHDFARLPAGSCCVRYATAAAAAPLVLRGPGGGAAAVASAVFADLLRAARDVGARDRGHRHLMRSVSFT